MRTIDPNLLPKAHQLSSVLGQNTKTTSGLTYGYFGGTVVLNTGSTFSVVNSTLSLTPSATNYVQMNPATGAVAFNTTGFTTGFRQLAKVTTNVTAIVSVTDCRDSAVYELTAGSGITLSSKVGAVTVTNSLLLTSQTVLAIPVANYTLAAREVCLLKLSAAPAGNLVLPANPPKDTIVYIKDIGANLNIYPVTVLPDAGNLIENASDMRLNVPRISVTLLYDGSNGWWLI